MKWVWYTESLLFGLGLTSVLPTLWGTFIFDDGEAILSNEDVTGKSLRTGTPKPIQDIFFNDFWGTRITHKKSHKSYRPFTTLTYRLDYCLWGQNPFPLHLSNWILHGINCILVLYFLRHCYGVINTSDEEVFPKLSQRQKKLTLWGSIIFSVHPVHVEPLGGLVGRADLLSSMTFLLGFILVSSFRNSGVGPYIFIVVIGIVGSLFKENTIVIVIFYLLLRLIRGRRRGYDLLLKELLYLITTIIMASSFVLWRLWFQGGPPIFQSFDNPPAFAESFFSKISSIVYIWFLNIFILINPIWLSFDWSMGCVSLIESPVDLRITIILLFVAIGIRLLYLGLRSKTILIGLLIGGTTFLPSSNLIFTVGFVIAERNLYLPSIGFSLLLSYSFLKGNVQQGKPYLIFVVIIFYVRSLQRSFDWINQDRLFLSALKVCPKNAKVHYNVGSMYGESSNVELAIQSYKRAIELKPDYYQAMNNLGNILRTTNQLEGAEYWLRKAVYFKDDFAAAWMNLGIVLSKKNVTEAMECYRNALMHRHFYPDCEYNIGNLYLDVGEKDLAMKSWNRTTALQPTHAQSWLNLIILLEQENRLVEAKEHAHKALAILGDSDDTLQFLMGNIYGRLEEYTKATTYFQKAIDICNVSKKIVPGKYWSNLGVLYHRWGKMTEARNCYTKALSIEPNMDSAKKNLQLLRP